MPNNLGILQRIKYLVSRLEMQNFIDEYYSFAKSEIDIHTSSRLQFCDTNYAFSCSKSSQAMSALKKLILVVDKTFLLILCWSSRVNPTKLVFTC